MGGGFFGWEEGSGFVGEVVYFVDELFLEFVCFLLVVVVGVVVKFEEEGE